MFHQLALELNIIICQERIIIALSIGLLISKGSVTKITSWVENSTIKEVLGIEQLPTENLFSAFDYLEECTFEVIENIIFWYWKKLASIDNESLRLDFTDTYQNGKYNNSSLRKGKEGKVLKIEQILLGVSFENGFPIFHKLYDGNI